MRSVADLISDIRFLTNEPDVNRFSNERIIVILNLGQDFFESMINYKFPENGPFTKEVGITRSSDGTYPLPANMYSKRAISSVYYKVGSSYRKFNKINQAERNNSDGYYIIDNKLRLSVEDAEFSPLILTYTKKLPKLKDTSSVSELPDCCESFLVEYAEAKIAAINSSTDFNVNSVFASTRLNALTDSLYPGEEINFIPITNIDRVLF